MTVDVLHRRLIIKRAKFYYSPFLTDFRRSECMLMRKGNRLTLFIVLSMVLGILTGYLVFVNGSPDFKTQFSTNIKLLSTIFIRLVQMIIAPLVFSTLVVGIAKLGDLKTVGRVGGKAILWFVTASLASLLLGLVLVNYFQ